MRRGRRPVNSSPTPSPLGQVLRQKRTELGLTLDKAHEATGISMSYISRLETGQIRRPAPVILERLVNAGLLPEDFAPKMLDIPTLTTADRDAIRQIVQEVVGEELGKLQLGPSKSETVEHSRSSVQSADKLDNINNIIRIPKVDNFLEPFKFPINRIEFTEDFNPRRRA